MDAVDGFGNQRVRLILCTCTDCGSRAGSQLLNDTCKAQCPKLHSLPVVQPDAKLITPEEIVFEAFIRDVPLCPTVLSATAWSWPKGSLLRVWISAASQRV
jgi:hypothetical protein